MNAIPAAVAVAFLAMGVLALARPLSIGKYFDRWPWIYFGIEATGAAALAWALV
jgi:hypothetical protein